MGLLSIRWMNYKRPTPKKNRTNKLVQQGHKKKDQHSKIKDIYITLAMNNPKVKLLKQFHYNSIKRNKIL